MNERKIIRDERGRFIKGGMLNWSGKNNPFYNKMPSKENREKASIRWKLNNPMNKKENRDRISERMKINNPSHRPEIREKISLLLKQAYSKGKCIPPNKDKVPSEERRKKQSEIMTKMFEEGKLIPFFKGKHFTKEHKDKLSKIRLNLFKEGKIIAPHKGKHLSEEHKRKQSVTKKRMFQEGKLVSWLKDTFGEAHPSWKGGKSFEPYTCDFNKRLKELVRERDGRGCQLCNLFEGDCIKLYHKKLVIHHIDYDKVNSFPQNLISLCVKCHLITNNNRNNWTIFFQSMLKEKYNYEYTQDQKIILDFMEVKK